MANRPRARERRTSRILLVQWLYFIVFLCSAHAAEPLTVRIDTTDLRLRRDAPIPLEIQLDNHTPSLRTGYVEVGILHRDRRVGVHRSAEVTLSPGPRVVSLLLPPVSGVEAGDGLAVRLRFVGAEGAVDLGDHRLGSVNFGRKEFIVAHARTDRRTTKLEALRERSLRLENLRPKTADSLYLPFSTIETSLAAERLPTQPIGWCAYDLAVIDGPALLAMNEKQLTALARWIEGGGSAAIFAEVPLADRQLAFLRRLATDDAITLDLDEQSRLKSPVATPLRLAPGLGHAVVTTKIVDDEKALEQKEWRAEVGWMWRLTPNQFSHVQLDGTWTNEREEGDVRPYRSYPPSSFGDLGYLNNFDSWLRTGAMGFDDLSPDRPRPLPLGLVASLLGILLLAAGPVDWFLLGWLRRRRWTWIYFSLLCLVAAWLATQLAARYLGRLGRSGLVRIIDVGPGNRVLRETRITLAMPADDGEWRTETVDGVSVPLQRSELLGDNISFPGDGQTIPVLRSRIRSGAPGEWVSEWAGSGRYVLRQNLRQWTPAWRQSLSFPATSDFVDTPDWAKFIAAWPAQESGPLPTAPNGQWNYIGLKQENLTETQGRYPQARNYPAGTRLLTAWDIHARELFSGTTDSTGGLITNEVPAPASVNLPSIRLTHPLGIIAYRMQGHELTIYRRHVSKRELEAKP